MDNATEIVITGLGVVSPIGSGIGEFWDALMRGATGIDASPLYSPDEVTPENRLPYPMSAQVKALDIKRIRPRKNVKVMARDIQLGFVASDFARESGKLEALPVEPERQGIVFGTMMIDVDVSELAGLYAGATGEDGVFVPRLFGNMMNTMYPLWMLKYLPNMTACHIGIANDLRGPSNTLVAGEVGGIGAFVEAVRVLERGAADVMYAGGCASCVATSCWTKYDLYEVSRRIGNPATAYRPFDVDRDGVVFGEGAGTCILETRQSAQRRGVDTFAKVLGHAETTEPVWFPCVGFQPQTEDVVIRRERFLGKSISNAIRLAMDRAGVGPEDLAFVMASGNGSITGDRVEARRIAEALGSDVPVTCIKGAVGYSLSGSSAMEIVAAVLALSKGVAPQTVNCDRQDPECPIRVVAGAPLEFHGKKAALALNYNFYGQAAALVLGVDG